MSDDDLVKRLLDIAGDTNEENETIHEAADRIEKLDANFQLQLEWYLSNKRILDERIEKLEAALEDMAQFISRADWTQLKKETLEAWDLGGLND